MVESRVEAPSTGGAGTGGFSAQWTRTTLARMADSAIGSTGVGLRCTNPITSSRYTMTTSVKKIGASMGPLALLFAISACGGGYGGPAPSQALPSAASAYIAGAISNTISVHGIDGQGGLQAVRSTMPGGESPMSLAAHPNGRLLYVGGFHSSDILPFTINGNDGSLISGQPPVSTVGAANPTAMAVQPAGRFLYVATMSSTMLAGGRLTAYQIDATSGALKQAGTPAVAGVHPTSIAIAPGGAFAYVTDLVASGIWIMSIDAATGTITNTNPAGAVAAGLNPVAIALDPAGRFAYVANRNSGDVSTFAVAPSGALTPVGNSVPAGLRPQAVAVHPSGRFAYVVDEGSNDVSVYRIDSITGLLSATGTPVSTGSVPGSITFNQAGVYAYVTNSGSSDVSVYAVNGTTGALTPIGGRVATGAHPVAMVIVPRAN